MKYLKEFEATADYAAYSADTENFILPNISVCNDDIYKVYYNIPEKPVLRVKYNVEDASEPTQLYLYSDGSEIPVENYAVNLFTEVEIDGVKVSVSALDAAQGMYELTVGEHLAEYSLKDQTTIGTITFTGCRNIVDVIIPNGVTSIIGESITMGSDTYDIGPFYGCENLTGVTIPNSVTIIGNNVFELCPNIESINIPDSVTSIGEFAFAHCGLKNLRIGSGLTSLCDSSFVLTTNASAITVDANNTVYDSRNNCNAIIETNTNKLIQGCKNTIIPNSVISTRDGVFFNEFGGVYLGAFTSLIENVRIPNSLTYIGTYAFNFCSELTSVTVEATTPPTLGEGAFDNNSTSGRKIYVPSASVDAYKAATNWSTYASDIEAMQ